MSLVPTNVLARYGFEQAALEPITAGHLNQTLRVDVHGRRFILQRLNKIFGAEVHDDIYAVTEHLARRGLLTPRLVRTNDKALCVQDESGVYRVFTFIEGTTHLKATEPQLCMSAGALLGRFHTAVNDVLHDFKNKRGNIHDPQKHAERLRAAIAAHGTHDFFQRVSPIADDILLGLDALPSFANLPRRIVHGDPKISNVLFGPRGEALCLVDLDTMFPSNIAFELGDALRSWCNPHEEDVAESYIDPKYFEAGVRGYATGARTLVSADEVESIVPGVETIALELAARFAADALEESYFGWDKKRFTRAAEHNLARANGQLAIAHSVRRQRQMLEGIVTSAFASS